jgi:tRNA(Ile)-lysidine synthase
VLQADGDKIPATAVYRFREEGDVIQRFGGGTKTLKKFFNEEKTPVAEREYLPLIAEENGEVYVVCGVEISEKVKVTADTKMPLYISIQKK